MSDISCMEFGCKGGCKESICNEMYDELINLFGPTRLLKTVGCLESEQIPFILSPNTYKNKCRIYAEKHVIDELLLER